jgi:hypothetical protein
MRDLIIGCATNYNWSQLKYWVNSINQSGFTGEKVLVLMNCDKYTCLKVTEAGFKIIGFEQDEEGNLTHSPKFMVHVERFLHIHNYIRLNSEKFRYVITTDVKDVVFQKNPSDWIEQSIGDKNLIFSSESILYKDEPWGNQNLMETYGPFIHDMFKNNEIFNVGVLAGHSLAIRDLCLNIFVSSAHAPIAICDQSTFNFMISQKPYTETSLYARSEYGWASQLGTTADPSKMEQFAPVLLEPSPTMNENGEVVTSTGKVFTIAHQYDRIDSWKEIIEKKYG